MHTSCLGINVIVKLYVETLQAPACTMQSLEAELLEADHKVLLHTKVYCSAFPGIFLAQPKASCRSPPLSTAVAVTAEGTEC
jgi:hypothetical protein